MNEIYILGYDKLDKAIYTISSASGTIEFKLSYTSDCIKLENRILKGLSIAKAIDCINGNFKKFREQYNIEYRNKLFWDRTSWAIIYKEPYTFCVYSGAEIAGQYGILNSMHLGVVKTIVAQCRALLSIAEKEWPQQRYSDLYKKVQEFAFSRS